MNDLNSQKISDIIVHSSRKMATQWINKALINISKTNITLNYRENKSSCLFLKLNLLLLNMFQLSIYFKDFTYSNCGSKLLHDILSHFENFFFPLQRVRNIRANSSHFEWFNANSNGEWGKKSLIITNDRKASVVASAKKCKN